MNYAFTSHHFQRSPLKNNKPTNPVSTDQLFPFTSQSPNVQGILAGPKGQNKKPPLCAQSSSARFFPLALPEIALPPGPASLTNGPGLPGISPSAKRTPSHQCTRGSFNFSGWPGRSKGLHAGLLVLHARGAFGNLSSRPRPPLKCPLSPLWSTGRERKRKRERGREDPPGSDGKTNERA